MRRKLLNLLVGLVLLLPLMEGCGDPLTKNAANRGRSKIRSWLRYEFQQAKNHSYGESQIKQGMHVIGYEPSWLIMDSLYLDYPYQLLSDLVIGEYDMNPRTGFSRNDSGSAAFRQKDIIEVGTSVNEDLNVLLAVTDYGDYGYRREFLTEIAKKNLLNSLDLILTDFTDRRANEDREKVGVLLDFPKLSWNLRNDYAEFLARLDNDLDNKEAGKGCLIYTVLPPIDENEIYSDSLFSLEVRKHVDLFVLRAHTFGEKLSPRQRSPMIPTDWPDPAVIDLDSSINYYVKECKIPRNRLLVEFPYYGTVYLHDTVISHDKPLIPLNEIINLVDAPNVLDTFSFSWKRTVDTTSFFFEDTLSLSLKYSWLLRNKLAGVSLYGLGYGHGMDEPKIKETLWDLISSNFGQPAPRLLFPGVGFLLLYMAVGVIGSVIYNWQVRYILRAKRSRFWFYLSLLFFMIVAAVLCILPVQIISVKIKLISLVVLLIYPLGRKALKFLKFARK
jgi:hypothetical protein